MKIREVKTFAVFAQSRNWVFVKIYTDEGIDGVGEASLEGKTETMLAAVEELSRYLVGKDPRDIEFHCQSMYRQAFWRGGPVLNSAISGVEQAMWDILGKSLGVPVHRLLGGPCRDRIRVYANTGGGETPEQIAERANLAVEKGYNAIKFCPVSRARPLEGVEFLRRAAATMKAARDAVGENVDILLDLHGRLSPAVAIQVAEELAPYRPFFLEEPCLPENVDALARVAHAVNTPIATGERLFTKFGFREVLEKQAAAVIQPDICHCGGIFEARKIAAMAETYYVGVAPHNPLGPVCMAASLQLDACCPNFLLQEYRMDRVPGEEAMVEEPLVLENGYAPVPTKPGLGIELKEEEMLKHPYQPVDLPPLFHEDGAVADW